jgi:hypothetical protein
MASEFETIANKLMVELKDSGIDCYLWDVSKGGSTYIRFVDPRMCTVRIANHDGINKFKCKYNIRTDLGLRDKKWIKDGDIWRLFMPLNMWKDLISMLIERYNEVQCWTTTKYRYGIPAFKRKLQNK